jgi:hypothetical protein
LHKRADVAHGNGGAARIPHIDGRWIIAANVAAMFTGSTIVTPLYVLYGVAFGTGRTPSPDRPADDIRRRCVVILAVAMECARVLAAVPTTADYAEWLPFPPWHASHLMQLFECLLRIAD